jgi:hypothetical protein
MITTAFSFKIVTWSATSVPVPINWLPVSVHCKENVSMFYQPPIMMDQMANNLAVVDAVQLFARHANPKIRVRWYNQLLGAFTKLRKATISFVMSARLSGRSHGTTRLPPDGFSLNLIFEDFFENLSRKFKFNSNRTIHTKTNTFLITSRSFLQTKVVEEIKTIILCSVTFFSFFENRAVYEILWKSIVVERGRPQMKIWRMRIASWIPKATNTHTQVV